MKFNPNSCVRKYFSRCDGPRQNPDHSKMLTSGVYGTNNQRWELAAAGALWAFTYCRECKQLVGSTFLNDGSEWRVEIDLDADGKPVAVLHRPHRCLPILVQYENCRWDNGRPVTEAEHEARFAEWLKAPLGAYAAAEADEGDRVFAKERIEDEEEPEHFR